MDRIKPLLIILLSIGLIWLKSSLAKFASGNFVSSLGAVLTKVADKNPYPPVKQFLMSFAIPNSLIFGQLVLWGELLTAVSIISGAIILLIKPGNKLARLLLVAGLAGGLFLNITFWLAFGYTSPATDSLNLLMGMIEIVGIIAFILVLY